MNNMPEIKNRDEYLFITYDDIIKTFKPYVMQLLTTNEYKEVYKEILNYEKIENKSFNELFLLSLSMTEKNIFSCLTNFPFDYDETYFDLVYNQHPEIIKESKLLSMGRSIKVLLTQNYVKKIYIYTKEYNQDIYEDLKEIYNSESRIEYVGGPINEVIDSISDNITFYALNDIEIIKILIEKNRVNNSNIILGSFGYNYKFNNDGKPELKVNNIEEIAEKCNFKLGVFNPDPSIE